jgi:hypothetical protein
MISSLPKAVQKKKWMRTSKKKQMRTSKKSEVLSSSPYKNALLAMRKEPSNNKQGRKTLRYDCPSIASTYSDSCR